MSYNRQQYSGGSTGGLFSNTSVNEDWGGSNTGFGSFSVKNPISPPNSQSGKYPQPAMGDSNNSMGRSSMSASVKLELSSALYSSNSGTASKRTTKSGGGSYTSTAGSSSRTGSGKGRSRYQGGAAHSSHTAEVARKASQPYSPNQLKQRRKLRKNHREKQRRMELNDKFDKLCSMLNLGKKTKTEKFTVLSEAINLIASLRQENEDLRRERSNLRTNLQKMTTAMQTAFPSQPPVDLIDSMGTGSSSSSSKKTSAAAGASGSGPPSLSPMIGDSLPPLPKLTPNTMLPFADPTLRVSGNGGFGDVNLGLSPTESDAGGNDLDMTDLPSSSNSSSSRVDRSSASAGVPPFRSTSSSMSDVNRPSSASGTGSNPFRMGANPFNNPFLPSTPFGGSGNGSGTGSGGGGGGTQGSGTQGGGGTSGGPPPFGPPSKTGPSHGLSTADNPLNQALADQLNRLSPPPPSYGMLDSEMMSSQFDLLDERTPLQLF